MTFQATLQSPSNYFGRVWDVMSNVDNLLEGTFWVAWCGFSICNLTTTIADRKKLDALPDTEPEKADKIWQSNKEVLVASCSAVSGSSMIISWLNDVSLITLGALGPIVSCFGYGGSSLASFSKAWDTLVQIDRGISSYYQIKDVKTRTDIALLQLHNMIKVAFYACIAAWGAFGAIHAIVGGAALFAVMDTCFYYGVILFLTTIASSFIVPQLSNASSTSHQHSKI